MKVKRFLFGLLLIISMIFVTVVEAATPDKFTLLENGQINESGQILRGSDIPAFFTYKYANIGGTNYIVLCTGYRKASASMNTEFKKNNSWSAPVRAGIAAIIANGIGANATTTSIPNDENFNKTGATKLYFTQIALWKYIQQEVGTNQELSYTLEILNATQLSRVNSLYNLGEAAKANYNKIANFSISTNSQKLTFTLDGNTYVSNTITVSGDELKSSSATVSKGTVTKSGNSYVVRIPKSDLAVGKNTITLTINATSNSIPLVSNYTNGMSGEQTTTIALFDDYSENDSVKLTGEITIEQKKISISKQDITNSKELSGATLELTKPDGKKETWVSGTSPKVFTDLPDGKYTLIETDAPEGYVKSSETITFNIKNGVPDKNPIVMKNQPKGNVYISKIDATTGDELPGATLVLKDSKGKEVDSWISKSTPHKVKVKLAAGKYTLTETEAPDGYVKNTKSVTFTVEEDGTVKTPVVMKNEPKGHVYISKQDATTGKELPGASLVLKDSKGNVVDSWTSGVVSHKVEKILSAGKYTLTETIAPDGYVKSSKTVTFTVKEDGTTDGVVIMENEPEKVSENPKTGTTLMFSLMIAFVAFAVSFYYYADYRLKSNM